MKLTARKTMVALGTAATVTLSGLSAPAMADDVNMNDKATVATDAQKNEENGKVECSSEEGDALYSQKYHSVEINKAAAKATLTRLLAIKDEINESQLDSVAKAALADATVALNNVEFRLNKVDLPPKKCGKSTSPEYGELKNAADQINDAERDLKTAEAKLRDAKPVVCESKGKDDSSSVGPFGFGSILQSFGSSGGEKKDSGSAGQMKVTKDGKDKCVSRVDYYSDKLKSIVSILTVVFTVITTVTKINETIQKQVMPK